MLVNESGNILHISGRTGKYLEPAAGKANLNIFAMARDGLRHEDVEVAANLYHEHGQPVIQCNIRDNGQGFQIGGNAQSKKRNRLGLTGMRERAEMVAGTFQVDSTRGGPTTVRASIPAS